MRFPAESSTAHLIVSIASPDAGAAVITQMDEGIARGMTDRYFARVLFNWHQRFFIFLSYKPFRHRVAENNKKARRRKPKITTGWWR